MKRYTGIVILVIAICVSLFIGGSILLIDGIIQIIAVLTMAQIAVPILMQGIFEIIFASFIGCFIFYICKIIHYAHISNLKKYK